MTGIQIVAAVVDTKQLILYQSDGTTINIPQGDRRIRPILDQIMPILNAGGVATISLEMANEYASFEKKSNGLVRLFRVAKNAVAHLFGSDDEREPNTIAPGLIAGQVPNSAIEEILAQATPVTAESFKESETTVDHTMVAVVGSGSKAKIVPGVEALKGQMAHSNKLGSSKGVEALIDRLSKIVDKRGHSVQDVLRFMEMGDLPVADDGSIIAYKILKTEPSHTSQFKAEEGVFFDCHTGKIPQKVGSYVCVDEKLVDRDRRNECSNGLHIARRGYLGSFHGDVCVLTKIAPEDVVTVPHNDPNKVRVCGYHILGVIPDSEFQNLKSNRPMTESPECRRLLDQAISGQHVARLEEVKMTEQHGEGIVITDLGAEKAAKISAPKPKPGPMAVALDDKSIVEKDAVDPKAISRRNQEQKSQPSRAVLVAELLARLNNKDLKNDERLNAAAALVALKKRSKVSYHALGVSTKNEQILTQALAGKLTQKPQPVVKPPAKIKAIKAKDLSKDQVAAIKAVQPKPVPTPAPTANPKKPTPVGNHVQDGPRQIEAKRLYAMMMDKNWNELRRADAAQKLLDHKRKSKVSFTALGLPQDTSQLINKTIAAVK